MKRNPPLHIVAVTGVVIREGKFLAGRRDRKDKDFPGKWCFPGGKVEVGEDPEQALRGEVRDEAGVEIKNTFFSHTFKFVRSDGFPVIGLVFGCDYDSGEVVAGEDMETMEWTTLDDLRKKDLLPGVFKDAEKVLKTYKDQI